MQGLDEATNTWRRVRAALERAADGACALDHGQRILFWNQAAAQLLHHRAEEVMGRPCYEVFCGKPRPGCVACEPGCSVVRRLEHGGFLSAYRLLSRTREGRPLLLNVSVISPTPEAPIAAILLFRDVSHELHYEAYVDHILAAAAHLPPPQTTSILQAADPLRRQVSLTPRETEVLHLLVQGHSLRQIAAVLRLRYATVRNYVQQMLRKFGVHSQRDLVRLALSRPSRWR